MLTCSILLNLQKILLCMAPNLNNSLRSNKSFYLFPITIKELEGLKELVVLLLRPALARLGDGVRLPHLLAGVLPSRARRCRGRVGRRLVGGDHGSGACGRSA